MTLASLSLLLVVFLESATQPNTKHMHDCHTALATTSGYLQHQNLMQWFPIFQADTSFINTRFYSQFQLFLFVFVFFFLQILFML